MNTRMIAHLVHTAQDKGLAQIEQNSLLPKQKIRGVH